MSLLSLPIGYHAVVFGANGGIGAALVRALGADPRCGRLDVGARGPVDVTNQKIRAFQFDLEDELSIVSAARSIAETGPVHLVIVATGVLQDNAIMPEKSWRSLQAGALQRAFAINVIGPALIGKHMLPLLAKNQKTVFAALSARVGSISDNRLGGWHAYRTSKAALNMMFRNFAIELSRTRPLAVCATLHPGTVATKLSQPFQGGAKPGAIVSPDLAADRLMVVLDKLSSDQSGLMVDWKSEVIPF